VSSPFDLSRAHRQQRRSAFERLNLALLVHAQNLDFLCTPRLDDCQ
jgi:hypothetical protein